MGFQLANVSGRAALANGDSYYDLAEITGTTEHADPMVAIGLGQQLHDVAAGLGEREPTGKLADATLEAPVPRPQKSFAIGLNYKAHADEGGMEVPDAPLVFTKFPSCLAGPNANVEMRSDACDYEGELVVVLSLIHI